VAPSEEQGSGSRASGGGGGGGGDNTALTEIGPCRFRLTGTLDLNTVTQLTEYGQRLVEAARRCPESPRQPAVEIDLSGVKRATSAAIALLLEWVDLATQHHIELGFTNWPASLVHIAAFSNVDGLLGIDDPTAGDGATPPIAWTSS
jgi:phospholipid transport system transporter-binding protein